jgi:hypothetical protein
MRRPSAVIRLVWIGFAMLQRAEPAAVQLADGHLEATSPVSASRTHVEDQANGRCAPVHPSDCALCRFLAQPLFIPARAVPLLGTAATPIPLQPAAMEHPSRGSAFLPFSRAPPRSV